MFLKLSFIVFLIEKEVKQNDPVVKTSPELTSVHAVQLLSPTSSSNSDTKQESTVQSANSTPHWKGADRRNSNSKGIYNSCENTF